MGLKSPQIDDLRIKSVNAMLQNSCCENSRQNKIIDPVTINCSENSISPTTLIDNEGSVRAGKHYLFNFFPGHELPSTETLADHSNSPIPPKKSMFWCLQNVASLFSYAESARKTKTRASTPKLAPNGPRRRISKYSLPSSFPSTSTVPIGNCSSPVISPGKIVSLPAMGR